MQSKIGSLPPKSVELAGMALLYGTSVGILHKLQRIQNTFAKLVCPGHTHSSDTLRILHWLPVRQRIDFKIATLTFKLLNFGSPAHLACLLKLYLPVRALRSHGQQLLVRPHVKSSIGSIGLSNFLHPLYGILYPPHQAVSLY